MSDSEVRYRALSGAEEIGQKESFCIRGTHRNAFLFSLSTLTTLHATLKTNDEDVETGVVADMDGIKMIFCAHFCVEYIRKTY